MHGTTQSDSDNIFWETPKTGNFGKMPWGIAHLRLWYKLELDVCAEDIQQSCCVKFLTATETWRKHWDVNFFMNAPWKTEVLEKMLLRAISESSKHHVVGVCLLPSYTGADWFTDLVFDVGAHIVPIKGRVRYWKDREPYSGSPNIDSILAIYNYAEMK